MTKDQINSYTAGPDENGRFGDFGGRFVSETLMPLILALEDEYRRAQTDPAFAAELDDLLRHYVGRPPPHYFADGLTAHFGGAKIYLKREELKSYPRPMWKATTIGIIQRLSKARDIAAMVRGHVRVNIRHIGGSFGHAGDDVRLLPFQFVHSRLH